MHELSLAGGVLRLVEDAAAREGFRRVQRLVLEAGALSGVEVRALRFAIESLAPGTCLEDCTLQIDEPLVKFEFIRMPDSTGFGDYTESGQVIPVSFQGRKGGYSHCMFLDDHPPIAGGRELWGFPKKLAKPTLRAEIDTLVGTLDYGPIRIATVRGLGYCLEKIPG
mgnify:CR=1 FL=1